MAFLLTIITLSIPLILLSFHLFHCFPHTLLSLSLALFHLPASDIKGSHVPGSSDEMQQADPRFQCTYHPTDCQQPL
uniref:Uncharacterized protein n=1 Tax=Anguilla anguilla TaxID=7936 RepID=A0A0E9X5L4_ANGAN